jgi:L-ascorbate metabolism protein UlaG (beta-lactamase superfamily)
MLGPLGHVGAGVAYLATQRRRQVSDAATAQQLAWPDSARLPAGLSLRWLGTAGFRLEYQDLVVWIDPYVTRVSFADVMRRRLIRSSPEACARHVDRADAILVGHTHFDHAMDVPTIARATGAMAYGSTSLAHLMQLHGLAAQATIVEPHRAYEIGPFRVRFVPSVHSKLLLGLAIPEGGELTCEHVEDFTRTQYRCGQVWGIAIEVAGITLYHQGSADLVEAEIRDRNVDVFLCGIAGRRFTPRYMERICAALSPAMIVPMHFDDFFRPYDAPTRSSFNVNLTGFAEEVHRATREVPVRALAVGQEIRG